MSRQIFSIGQEPDHATTIWGVVLGLWVIATVGGWLFGGTAWALADFPSALAAVLVAVPIAKGMAIGLRSFGKGS